MRILFFLENSRKQDKFSEIKVLAHHDTIEAVIPYLPRWCLLSFNL